MTDARDDETLTCLDCGQTFVWTKGEQSYFTERQLSRPKRCRLCRELRRAEREQADAGRQ